MGLKCCSLIKQLLHDYSYLEPLTIVLKKFLAVHDLNAPFQGGLSSYGVILMIVAFLRQNDDLELGEALAYFLEYYGKIFNTGCFFIDKHIELQP